MAKELNIIWVINIVLPEAARQLGLPVPVIGGWLSAYRESLRALAPLQRLTIVSPYAGDRPLEATVGGDLHYLFPEQSKAQQRRQWFHDLVARRQPDVVHLHGSEYPHAFDFLSVCDPAHVVLSIQGLVSVYANYYYGGMTPWERLRHTTLRDLLRRDILPLQRLRFVHNGVLERRMIAQVGSVIGRTDWDHAHCCAIHPEVRYFACNEPLRTEFYTAQWERTQCFDPPTIFVSQAHYPLKALHQVLKALPPVIARYPDLQVHIAGNNLMDKPTIKRSTYGYYLKRLAEQLHLTPHLHYLGPLTAPQMVEQYLGARLFISPSCIENSSNSICEAQLVGTPVIASYVGGTADLIDHRRTGLLYRFEETAMLTDYILELLGHDDLCRTLSAEERAAALVRHDHPHIACRLMEIYQTVADHPINPCAL